MVDMTLHALQRRLATLLPGSAIPEAGGPSLEALARVVEPPRVVGAESIEGSALRARVVPGDATPGFAAFLDGTQRSEVLQHAGGSPIICGTVAAVVRRRRDRRMATWQHAVERRVYAARTLLTAAWNAALDQLGLAVVDISETDDGPTSAHPYAVRDSAIRRVQRDRDALEQKLAREWCEQTGEPLFIDGGISGNHYLASAAHVVGVVKSHSTLYAEGDAMRIVFALRAGERSTAFRIRSAMRSGVSSWYLRLREPTGHDPLWGLVRVEVREEAGAITDRADAVSRWILAELRPLAMPDARWDRMVYGIRDCEEFLRAIA
jgi:hypothetical protein